MLSFSICRVVGNELPPRDAPGTKLECLKYIVEVEKLENAHRIWIINHIIDEDYKSKIYDILKNEEVHEIFFDYEFYKKQKTWNDKVTYSININAARNFGIKLSQEKFDYVACLDQDCYFSKEQWKNIVYNIENDKNKTDYYCLISKRFHINSMPEAIDELIDEEPMIIFNKKTKILFDESIRFGDCEKLNLLWKIGMKKEENKFIFGGKSKFAGYVMHVGFGDELIETNVTERVRARKLALNNFISKIDKKHLNKKRLL